jgi:hypothetical protein
MIVILLCEDGGRLESRQYSDSLLYSRLMGTFLTNNPQILLPESRISDSSRGKYNLDSKTVFLIYL